MQRLRLSRRLEASVFINVSALLGPVPFDMEKAYFWAVGDANQDGAIDWADVSAVRRAYGSTPGDPNWNPLCDFDQNAVINMADQQLVATNYGRTIKPGEQLNVDVRIVGPGISTTVKSPATVTITQAGEYAVTCGGQTKKLLITEADVGGTVNAIFYLTQVPSEIPWDLVFVGVGLVVVMYFLD